MDALGLALGRQYAVERELASGGMSRTFVAEEKALGRKVVVKVLPADMAGGVNVERFKREIQLAARLQQAHIVPVLAAGEVDGLPYYTMPFVEGRSLRECLAHRTLALPEIVSVLRGVAKALACAHDHGVVHRDIKPDNVLMSGGSAMVTDFGIAKAISDARVPRTDGTLTQSGTTLGTPAYMAPEQAAGDTNIDHRADIYSFGCLAYELLSGKPPFHDMTPQRLIAAQVSGIPADIGTVATDMPAPLAALVMQCLAKDPALRPQTAAALVRDLEAATFGGDHRPALWKTAASYVGATIVAVVLARVFTLVIGLPGWVLPATLIVMAVGFVTVLAIAIGTSMHLSWRRGATAAAIPAALVTLATIGYMGSRALGIGPAASLFGRGALSEQDRLVVADFEVGGGDSTLGGQMAEMVRTALKPSLVVRVVPLSRVADVLQAMRHRRDERLSPALAREVAQRDGAKGLVTGTLSPVGSGFLVGLKLVNASSGDELASFHGTANNLDALIPTVGDLTDRMREKIGESFKHLQGSPPLHQVTTTSMAAFRKFYQGNVAFTASVRLDTALARYMEATRLDSNFASAYLMAAFVLDNMGIAMTSPRYVGLIEHAHRLSERLPEPEREMVNAVYYDVGPHADRTRAVAAYRRVLAAPGDPFVRIVAASQLAGIYSDRRNYALAESLYRQAIAMDTTMHLIQGHLLPALVAQGKRVAAESASEVMRRRDSANPSSLIVDRWLPYARGGIDSAITVAEAQHRSSLPFAAFSATGYLANVARTRGRLAEWSRLYAERQRRVPVRGAYLSAPFTVALDIAETDATYRDGRRAVAIVDSLVASAEWARSAAQDRPYFRAATVYALANAAQNAHALLAQHDAQVRDTAVLRLEQPERFRVDAEVALSEHRPQDAIRGFLRGDSMPDGFPTGCLPCVHVALGRAFDAAGMRDSAIARYEAYLASPDLLQARYDSWWLALVLERLGRLHEARGDVVEATGYYRRFVDLWQNADAELQPRVARVRQRLAGLAGLRSAH